MPDRGAIQATGHVHMVNADARAPTWDQPCRPGGNGGLCGIGRDSPMAYGPRTVSRQPATNAWETLPICSSFFSTDKTFMRKILLSLLIVMAITAGVGSAFARDGTRPADGTMTCLSTSCKPIETKRPEERPRRPEGRPICGRGQVMYLGSCRPACSAGIANNCGKRS